MPYLLGHTLLVYQSGRPWQTSISCVRSYRKGRLTLIEEASSSSMPPKPRRDGSVAARKFRELRLKSRRLLPKQGDHLRWCVRAPRGPPACLQQRRNRPMRRSPVSLSGPLLRCPFSGCTADRNHVARCPRMG